MTVLYRRSASNGICPNTGGCDLRPLDGPQGNQTGSQDRRLSIQFVVGTLSVLTIGWSRTSRHEEIGHHSIEEQTIPARFDQVFGKMLPDICLCAPWLDMPTAEQCTARLIGRRPRAGAQKKTPQMVPSRPVWLARQESWSTIQPCIIRWSRKHWPMPCYLCHVIALAQERRRSTSQLTVP